MNGVNSCTITPSQRTCYVAVLSSNQVVSNKDFGVSGPNLSTTELPISTTSRDWLQITSGIDQPSPGGWAQVPSTINSVNALLYKTSSNWYLWHNGAWTTLNGLNGDYIISTTVGDPLSFYADAAEGAGGAYRCINGACTLLTESKVQIYARSTMNSLYLTIRPNPAQLLGADQLWYSTNGGVNFTTLFGGTSSLPSLFTIGIFTEMSDSNIVVFGATSLTTSSIFTSTNNATSYTDIGLPNGVSCLDVGDACYIYYGSTPSNVLFSPAANHSTSLFHYSGGVWSQISTPSSLGINPVSCLKTTYPNDFLTNMSDNNYYLYTNGNWLQLTGGNNQPTTPNIDSDSLQTCNGFINKSRLYYPNITQNMLPINSSSMYYVDTNTFDLWFFNGSTWTQLTGGAGKPSALSSGSSYTAMYDANDNVTSLYIIDNTNKLWYYTGGASGTWTALSGGVNQPSTVTSIAIEATSTSIGAFDGNSFWGYRNGTWVNFSTGSATKPTSVNQIISYNPSKAEFVVLDSNYELWLYK